MEDRPMASRFAALIWALILPVAAGASTVQGRVAQLDGTPIDELGLFFVVATNQGVEVGRGRLANGTPDKDGAGNPLLDPNTGAFVRVQAPLVSAGPPPVFDFLRYSITIDESRLDPGDKRITLVFQAAGRDTITLAGLAGNFSQSIDIIMPVQRPEPRCCPCRACPCCSCGCDVMPAWRRCRRR